ncbi:NACHT, LRR and PYD domains-containing protein 14 [Microtus ochrogaster]|uniref:NACHT, LRR and PYD domains-containing protein 14 n=1 Tax=Microtus ochrogaster TaxID=79684 RepID=A0ABM0KR17_MICOH|nr:NACHT, LRR and PYD domains-containing protein 14 [Microtus ochrogaster]
MESEDAEVMEDQISQEKMLFEDKDFGDGTDYRIVIKEKFCVAWDKNSLTGESATLYQRIIKKDQKLLRNIFDTAINTYKMRQTVLLYGDAGVGKTTLLRRAMLEWADGNLFEKFAYVFYLSGREISQAKEKSFAQLISKNWPRSEVPIEQILSESRNLLFLIDSFDELDFSFEEPEFALCNDWTQEYPVSILISSLLRKVMLPESFLLVTARSTARKKLMPLLHKPHCVELPGLSENARMDYIQHFFLNDKKWAKGVIDSIRKNPRLFNMCHVCQMCWVVCTCLKQQVEKGGDIAMTCQTTTALFTCYVCSLFSRTDGSSVTLPNETLLRSLCQAAAEGIWTMKHILYKKNLRKHELTRNDISVFLDAKVLHEDTEYENCYTFTHLHVQEFFGALFYLLRENPEKKDYPLKPFESLYLLLESNHSEDPHLEQMKCFLFGLLNKEQVRQLEETFNVTISMDVRGDLLMCLEAIEKDDSYPSQMRLLDLFHCLYETQDNDFITQALSSFQKIAVQVVEEKQLLIYSFCFKHCYSLQSVKLTIKSELREILDIDPTDETCLKDTVARITHCWEDLFSVLHTNESLREMDLYESILDEALMKIINEELSHPKCKLQKLQFGSVCFLNSCQDFSFLAACHTLTHLDLKHTDLEDNGLRSLCTGLKCQQCKLRVLRLEACDVNVNRCQQLSEALERNSSLVFLNLSTNNLTNYGVKSLCKFFGNPNCCLERLSLASCGFTKDVCGILSFALTESRRLTHLCLADNLLGDEGIELLSDALKHPQCTLQSLVLRCGFFTPVGSEFLSTALGINRSLVHLDLGGNRLEDSGIKLLCHVLQQPTCTLEELELTGCLLTSESCLDLASVLVNSPNLWSLDLGNNYLLDAGLHILCDALKNPNCQIQRLGLENCGLTSACCQDLLSLFCTNQSLVQMNLMKNALGYDTIKNLCKVLRCPTCKMKFLALDKREIDRKKIKKFLNDVKINNPELVIRPHCSATESGCWWQYF